MKLIEWTLRGFRDETPEEKRQRAIQELRKALCFLHSPLVMNIPDEDLFRWLEIYPPGTGTKAQPINYVNSYVEVKPADEVITQEKENSLKWNTGLITILLDRFPISEEELTDVYNKCGKDPVKLTKVLKLMEYTLQTDDEVLANFEPYVKQYSYLLK